MKYYDPNDYRTEIATMGCADGDEIVAYQYQGKQYFNGFKRLWKTVNEKTETNGISEYKKPNNLKIWDGDNGFVNVKTIIKNPDQGNWYRVNFDNGRSILVTSDHPLYTENRGRIKTSELNVGDIIKTWFITPQFNEHDVFSKEYAYVLGLLITDGNYNTNITVSLDARTEQDIIDKFIHCVKLSMNCDCSITHYDRGVKGIYDTIRIKSKEQKSIVETLKKLFDGDKKIERTIPNEIFESSRIVRLSFLAGMIDGDGHVDRKSKIQLGSTNKELALQQLALAQSLGFPAKMYLNHYTKKDLNKIRYRVEFAMDDEISHYLGSEKKSNNQWNKKTSQTKTPDVISVKSIENLGHLNKESYDVETDTDKFTLSFINSGNCRTKTQANINGESITAGRGNFAFTTINLPMLAIESNRDIKKFYKLLNKTMNLCKEQLLWRLEQIGKRHVYNFPFLYGQNLWYKSEGMKPNDTIAEALKQASISIGFVGLAEALVALVGKHHGEDEDARKLGYEIIKHMRNVVDKYLEETHLNFSLFATPAESVAGRHLQLTRKKYGVIKGVTDREYFTNSMHVPVYYPIKAADKIKIEAPYHELCNAGVISYLEMDGDPLKNLNAFERMVRAMHDAEMNYFSINHAVDKCPSCGNTLVIDGHVCPICGYNEEIEPQKIKTKINNYNCPCE